MVTNYVNGCVFVCAREPPHNALFRSSSYGRCGERCGEEAHPTPTPSTPHSQSVSPVGGLCLHCGNRRRRTTTTSSRIATLIYKPVSTESVRLNDIVEANKVQSSVQNFGLLVDRNSSSPPTEEQNQTKTY